MTGARNARPPGEEGPPADDRPGDDPPPALSLRGLLGAPLDRLPGSLGEPVADRTVDAARWLIFERPGITLRVRCGAAAPHRIAFWTAGFTDDAATLREAADRVGLWPACEPDVTAAEVSEPLIRRALPQEGGPGVHSLTATVRDGRITALTAFDEPPDW